MRLLVLALLCAIPALGHAGGKPAATLTTPYGKAKRMQTPDGSALVLTTNHGNGAEVHQIVEKVDGLLQYQRVQPVATPYGSTSLVVGGGKLAHAIEVEGKTYEVAEKRNGGLVFTGKDGTKHNDVIKVGRGIQTQYGLAKLLRTSDGPKHIVEYGAGRYYEATPSAGQIQLTPIAAINTPYGATQIAVGGGKLEQRIEVGDQTYAVSQRRGGRIAFVGKDGKPQLDVVRVGTAVQTQYGLAKLVRTGAGSKHVVEYGQRFYEASVIDGQVQLAQLSTLATPYGATQLVAEKGKLEQRLTVGDQTYTVSERRNGSLAYTGKDGTAHIDAIRVGRGLQTQYGLAKLVRTSDGPKNVVEYGTGRFYEATASAGQINLTPISLINTPYGATQLVLEKGKLEQRLVFGDETYAVSTRADGRLAFVGKDGKPQLDAIRVGTALQTQYGLAKLVRTSAGQKNVVEYGADRYYEATAADGQIHLAQIFPIQTPYGATHVVLEKDKLEQRLVIGDKPYIVRERKDGYSYIGADGKSHAGVIRVGESLHTPHGDTRPLTTSDGRRDVLVSKDYYGRTSYQAVRAKGGELEYEAIHPIATPYGATQIEVLKGTLDQKIVVGGKRFSVSQSAKGAVVYTDAKGEKMEGAIRIGASLYTPQGKTKRITTDEGPRDVLVGDGQPGAYTFVDVRNGELAYTQVEPKTTAYGPARVTITGDRLEHWVDIEGKPYRVETRRGEIAYVDKRGKAYTDDWLTKLNSKTPAPNTVRRLAKAGLKALPPGPIVEIDGTQHMAQATYDQLRDAMIETMKMYPPSKHYFIGLGSDPHPILAFLENIGGRGLATNFPASGKYPSGVEPSVLDPYVRRLIPAEVLNGSKTLVLLDQTNSGANREGTLAQISRVFERYLASVGSRAKIVKLAFSPVAQPADTGHIDTNKYPQVGTFLSHPYEHVVSQYDRHVLGSNTPDQLVERPQYKQFKDAMRERMKRDTKLDAFLAKAAKN